MIDYIVYRDRATEIVYDKLHDKIEQMLLSYLRVGLHVFVEYLVDNTMHIETFLFDTLKIQSIGKSALDNIGPELTREIFINMQIEKPLHPYVFIKGQSSHLNLQIPAGKLCYQLTGEKGE